MRTHVPVAKALQGLLVLLLGMRHILARACVWTLCLCVGKPVHPSGAPGIYLCQWSGSSCHPRLTSGMFPESQRQVDLWKVHLSPQGSPCVLLLFVSAAEPNWFCSNTGRFVCLSLKQRGGGNNPICVKIGARPGGWGKSQQWTDIMAPLLLDGQLLSILNTSDKCCGCEAQQLLVLAARKQHTTFRIH